MEKKQQQSKQQWYQKFRWFVTSSGLIVIGGKSAQQNEDLLKKHLNKNDIILHTKEPGSPFCVVKAGRKKITSKNMKEAAIFCACFSQGWKKKKKKMEIHIFKGNQIMKEKRMKTGTFGVLGKVQKADAKLELWLGIQKGVLRAAPKAALKKPLLKILPGKINKEKMTQQLKKTLEQQYKLKFNKEEIGQAIPAGGFACL